MKNAIIEIYDSYQNPVLSEFSEALLGKELSLNTGLLEYIFNDREELQFAIKKAMQICVNCGLPISYHFKAIYTADHTLQVIRKEWKLSKLAYALAIINGNPNNPEVGRMQLELLKPFI